MFHRIAIHPNSPNPHRTQYRGTRRLGLEPLEERQLLAGDLAASALGPQSQTALDDFLVNYSLELTDGGNNIVDHLRIGDVFTLGLYVEHVSPEPRGVFSAFADVRFDPNIVEVDGEFEYLGSFRSVLSGTKHPGFLDEVGGLAGTRPNGGGRHLIAEIPFVAIADGTARFELDVADEEVQHPTLVYLGTSAVPCERISYENATLYIGSAEAGNTHDETPQVGDCTASAQSDTHQQSSDASPQGNHPDAISSAPPPSSGSIQADVNTAEAFHRDIAQIQVVNLTSASGTVRLTVEDQPWVTVPSATDGHWMPWDSLIRIEAIGDGNDSRGSVISDRGILAQAGSAIPQATFWHDATLIGAAASDIMTNVFRAVEAERIQVPAHDDLSDVSTSVVESSSMDLNGIQFTINVTPSAPTTITDAALIQHGNDGSNNLTSVRHRSSKSPKITTNAIRDVLFQELAADETDVNILPSLRLPMLFNKS